MNKLIIKNLSKTYPNGVKALNNVSIEIENGMFGMFISVVEYLYEEQEFHQYYGVVRDLLLPLEYFGLKALLDTAHLKETKTLSCYCSR